MIAEARSMSLTRAFRSEAEGEDRDSLCDCGGGGEGDGGETEPEEEVVGLTTFRWRTRWFSSPILVRLKNFTLNPFHPSLLSCRSLRSRAYSNTARSKVT